MNPAAWLLRLQQGNRAIEDYVADFWELWPGGFQWYCS